MSLNHEKERKLSNLKQAVNIHVTWRLTADRKKIYSLSEKNWVDQQDSWYMQDIFVLTHGWLLGWLILWYVNPCWVILCQHLFNKNGFQFYAEQNPIFESFWTDKHAILSCNVNTFRANALNSQSFSTSKYLILS